MAPGKTAPRLLQDLLTFDPRYEERAGRNLLTTPPPHWDSTKPKVAAVPQRNCRHSLFCKDEQSLLPEPLAVPDESTVYKVASYCRECRWHVDVVVDFRNNGPADHICGKGNTEYMLHHFLPEESDTNGINGLGAQTAPRTYGFRCSAPQCPAIVRIHMKPPHITDQDIETLTNQAQLRRRWEMSKQIAGDRADVSMARKVDGPDFLNTYLQDAMNPTKGKVRIPLLNKKFLKTFGRDCDSILLKFGFTTDFETEEDGETNQVWFLPRPEDKHDPLESSLRHNIQDARYELDILIMSMPDSERTNVRHKKLQSSSSRNHIERALACHDYEKVEKRATRNTNYEEDHPYYASLGAVGDFSDRLILFAFSRQVYVDVENRGYYFECLHDLATGRKSEELETQVAVLSSQGFIKKGDIEIAYRYFGIDPTHAHLLNDEHIIGTYKSRLSDMGVAAAEELRRQLRIIGDVRNSKLISAEASGALETYEQALSWLGASDGQADDFVETLYSVKIQDDPSSTETARKAVTIIANHRNSHRLRRYLKDGNMAAPEMDIGEAYALFSISDRTAKVDFDVMETAKNFAPADTFEKMQKAYQMIEEDQAANFNNRSGQSEVRRNSHPLETWPVGLRNIGNTCYLNSVLQFLFTIKPLRELVVNCEDKLQDPSPAALINKRVGRTAVTAERVEVAQKFIHELRTFFQHMITAPSDTVQPDIDLAALALCKTDSPQSAPKSPEVSAAQGKELGTIEGAPILGPMPAPMDIVDAAPEDTADSVMGDDDSDTSTKVIGLTDGDASSNVPPAPPNRPPPIPPRPAPATKSKLGNIEESARQQDAAEVLSNIFDLISCAIRGESVVRENEQYDIIKQLFFSDVTSVRDTKPKREESHELRDHFLVSPGWRNRNIYATLDDDFGLSELEGGIPKYDFVDKPAAIQIINLRRLQFDRVKGEQVYDRSHIRLEETLYLDRYLGKTQSVSEGDLLRLRQLQWAKQRRLREYESRSKQLKTTDVADMDLPDTIDETSAWLRDLEKEYGQEGGDSLPTPPPELADALATKAAVLKKELEAMGAEIEQLEAEVDTIFKDAREHPYRLHAVFTHRGGTKGGHYWIYIYDFQNGKWRKYNDDHVTLAKESDVLEQEIAAIPASSTGVVYIRADKVDELTQAVKREPDITQANGNGDVEMQDADDLPALEAAAYKDVQVIEGVEQGSYASSKPIPIPKNRAKKKKNSRFGDVLKSAQSLYHGAPPSRSFKLSAEDTFWDGAFDPGQKREGDRLESPPKRGRAEGEDGEVEVEDLGVEDMEVGEFGYGLCRFGSGGGGV